MIVLDTCALLWWTLEPEKLSEKALTLCQKQEEEGRLLVSTISIWEIGIKQKQGKLDLGMSLEKYVGLLDKVAALHFVPISNDVWIKSLTLDWSHKDPVDRVVVATAALENVSLLTKDSIIRKFYKKSLW